MKNNQKHVFSSYSYSLINLDTVLLGLYFLLAPFEQMLRFGPGTVLKYIAGLFVFLGIMRILIKKQEFHLADPIIFCCLLLIFISFLSSFWSIDVEFTFQMNVTTFSLTTLFIFAYIRNYNYKDLLFLKWMILIGGLSAILYLLLISTTSSFGILEARTTLEETDPNEFAALLILPMFVAFGEFFKSKNILFLGIFLLILFIVLLTGSRGAMIASIITLIVFSLYNFKIKTVISIVSILIIFYFFAYQFLPEYITHRLWGEGAISGDFRTRDTRVDIWSTLFKYALPDLSVIGNGSGSGGLVLSKYFYTIIGVHNTYFSLILDYGILGLPIFIYLLIKIFKLIKKENNYAKICSFIAIIVVIFFLDAMFKKFLWNVLIFCVVSVNNVDLSQIKRHFGIQAK